MVDYNNARALAKRLIAENGRNVDIVSNGPNTGSSFDPEYLTPVLTEDIKAVFTKFKTSEINGTLIKFEDKKLLIYADDIQKAVDAGGNIEAQRILDNGVEYSIKIVDDIYPGDLPILSKVRCRV